MPRLPGQNGNSWTIVEETKTRPAPASPTWMWKASSAAQMPAICAAHEIVPAPIASGGRARLAEQRLTAREARRETRQATARLAHHDHQDGRDEHERAHEHDHELPDHVRQVQHRRERDDRERQRDAQHELLGEHRAGDRARRDRVAREPAAPSEHGDARDLAHAREEHGVEQEADEQRRHDMPVARRALTGQRVERRLPHDRLAGDRRQVEHERHRDPAPRHIGLQERREIDAPCQHDRDRDEGARAEREADDAAREQRRRRGCVWVRGHAVTMTPSPRAGIGGTP